MCAWFNICLRVDYRGLSLYWWRVKNIGIHTEQSWTWGFTITVTSDWCKTSCELKLVWWHFAVDTKRFWPKTHQAGRRYMQNELRKLHRYDATKWMFSLLWLAGVGQPDTMHHYRIFHTVTHILNWHIQIRPLSKLVVERAAAHCNLICNLEYDDDVIWDKVVILTPEYDDRENGSYSVNHRGHLWNMEVRYRAEHVHAFIPALHVKTVRATRFYPNWRGENQHINI